MILSTRQLDVLNHVVEDGQAWADNATEASVEEKVAKYEADYDACVLVGNYKNRKDRDAEELATQIAEDQSKYDNAPYDVKRARAYLPLAEQLDMQYHDKLNGTTTWDDHVASVKAQFPKV